VIYLVVYAVLKPISSYSDASNLILLLVVIPLIKVIVV
jgi:hypothetical protein